MYIREAHPDSVLFTLIDGKEKLLKIPQTNDLAARGEAAAQCMATLKLSLPTVLDREDNKVNSAYAGWPDRLYVVGRDSKIAYQGAPGPRGFKIEEVQAWLEDNVNTSSRPPSTQRIRQHTSGFQP